MLDFLEIKTRSPKKGLIEIYPEFIIDTSNDVMIRGQDFYAIWVEERGMWSTNEYDVVRLVDHELDIYYHDHKESMGDNHVKLCKMRYSSSGAMDDWHHYCQKECRDHYHMLDNKLTFLNEPVKREDYVSKRLKYDMHEGSIANYEELISTLYSDKERMKIEWAIGCVLSGDARKVQKFMVLYGAGGTGKSTILHIIEKLFYGYWVPMDAAVLGRRDASFAMEQFGDNPLVALQHDGDLSKIEDNTRINSFVAHETMTINAKFQKPYQAAFEAFMFMGTNKAVKITDSKSGIIRRLIDVNPTGEKIPSERYHHLMSAIEFEISAIAKHCYDVYMANPRAYDNYIPFQMEGATNDVYNFVEDSYFIFKRDDQIGLKTAWKMWKEWCDENGVQYPGLMRTLKEELKPYFKEYVEEVSTEEGHMRKTFRGFKYDIFDRTLHQDVTPVEAKSMDIPDWLQFKEQPSIFDEQFADSPAQLAKYDDNGKDSPTKSWANCTTTLKDIPTSQLHYVKPPENIVTVDFDIHNESGEKDRDLNLRAAAKWPKTYAEFSKSGCGIHLEYIYEGDVTKLAPVYDKNIEIKVCTGGSSLRRKLSLCNDIPLAHINSGLPLKEEKVSKMLNKDIVITEKGMLKTIAKALRREIHPGCTKSNVDMIYKVLEDAYNSGVSYDLRSIKRDVWQFAESSDNQADTCRDLVLKMHFVSKDRESMKVDDAPDWKPAAYSDEAPIAFFDCEVFPNLTLVIYKIWGDPEYHILVNPKPSEIEEMSRYRLIGFNNRKYDNHICYATQLGYSNKMIYDLSNRLIKNVSDAKYASAYAFSYTDILDYAVKKQSLKKYEIELKLPHKELPLAWDKPVPEELWPTVIEYCKNDVYATEKVFEATQADFSARKILAEITNSTPNETTNNLTAKFIFGNDRKPQSKFNYRFMGDVDAIDHIQEGFDEYTAFTKDNKPIFPGYKFEGGKSYYRGIEVGEGGEVYAEPGMYFNVALLDISSMHPASVIAENLFGEEYTERFKEIRDARLAIKHKDLEKARQLLEGALVNYLSDKTLLSGLKQALKIAINSVYGETAAKFDNRFRDPRNVDNIVAKRGALFMINLLNEVQKRGFTVAHIKTDSIKIPNATPEIVKFVQDYGKLYGYDFEHEAVYERMCLVNNAVYIAKFATKEACEAVYGYSPEENTEQGGQWTATGTQFKVPYVFKSLFSHEPIGFDDVCETKSVQAADIYIDTGDVEKDEHNYIFVGKVGSFCPMKPGCGGGKLVRTKTKNDILCYDSVSGAKDYLWAEATDIENLPNWSDLIDYSYYEKLVADAKTDISQYGDFNNFVA